MNLGSDAFAVAVNWVDTATPGGREEYNFETFYRFPIFPELDLTISYQYIKDLAVTVEFDSTNVYSLRLTSTF